MLEIRHYSLWTFDHKLDVGCSFLQQFFVCAAESGTTQLRLEVQCEVCIGVILRRVGRRVEHPNIMHMRLSPASQILGMMNPQVADHQEYLVSFTVLYWKWRVSDGWLRACCPFEKFKADQTLVAHGRDHRQAKSVTRGHQHRRITRCGIKSYQVTILRHRCLIDPVEDAVLQLDLACYQGLDHLQPKMHVTGICLQGLTGGTLLPALALQVFSHRVNRLVAAKLNLDQIVYSTSFVQNKRQAPCRGRLRGHKRAQLPFLQQCQDSARQVGAPCFAKHQADFALSCVAMSPTEDCGGVKFMTRAISRK